MTVLDKLIVRGRSVLRMHDAAETATGGVPDGTVRVYNDGTSSFFQVYSRATGVWDRLSPDVVAAALYAPIDADFLVGTTNATLTGEIVAGTTPGGELGGTWGSPTVDTVHAEGGHAAMIATHAADGDAHHNQSHTVVSHSDTSATGAELNTLTDGSNADALHEHAGLTIDAVTTDQVFSADTTLATILSVTATANADAAVWGCLYVVAGSTEGDLKLQWTAPASAVAVGNAMSSADQAAEFTESSPGISGLAGDAVLAIFFSGVLDMAGTGGTFGLQAAENDAVGSVTVKKGSWMAYQEL